MSITRSTWKLAIFSSFSFDHSSQYSSLEEARVFLYAGIGLACLLLGANYLDYGILPVHLPRYMGMFGIEVGVGITVMAVMVSIFTNLIKFE